MGCCIFIYDIMKKYLSIILTASWMALSLVSCEDFLEETNKSGLTADPYFNTPEGIEGLVVSCYTPLRYWYGREEATNFTVTGTDILTKAAGHINTPVNDYSNDFKANNKGLNELWTWLYKAVNFTNEAMARLEANELENKQVLMGEVAFLRAFYYCHIVEFWGKTHLSTQPSAGAISTANPTEVDVIYEQIFKDLDLAIAQLPSVKERGGRITAWAAKAFKARMLLTRGQKTAAAELAQEVITDGGFALFDDYGSLWDMANSDGAGNSEVIWYVNYATDHLFNKELDDATQIRNGGNNLHLMYNMKYDDQPGMIRDILNGRPFNRYMPTRFMLELMDQESDQRWAGSFKWVWLMNNPGGIGDDYALMTDTAIWCINGVASPEERAWANNRYQIYDLNDVYQADGTVKNRLRYIEISKFLDPSRATVGEDRSSRDAFVIRISEMYLIVAEGLMETQSGVAVQYLNLLREKRALAGKEADMQVIASDLSLDFILDERAREFIGEQLRWFDLKRTGKLIERVKAHNPDASNINANHVLRPYPQNFLDAITNKEDFPQRGDY